MHPHVTETFSPAEQVVLSRYFTNLDQPVFALVNLPEVVKGALFARYSRSPKSLRRLFLDEFVSELDVTGDDGLDASMGLARAEKLYERVFGDYGDDSVAQLAGVHLACEQSSNVLTKILERGRLMSYLEQSTRYIAFDAREPGGHYRYYRDPELLESSIGARYVGEMDRMFDTYAELLPSLRADIARRHPRPQGYSEIAHRRAVEARALDALRGLLPAGSLANVGIYGSGQSFELLLLHLARHPLPEARRCGVAMLAELRKVIPSFLTRVDRPDRGGVWADYLAHTRERTAEAVAALFPLERREVPSSVTLVDFDPNGEDRVLAAICAPCTDLSEDAVRRRVEDLTAEQRAALLTSYIGDRTNRRHRPGRALEATSYRFEVVCDYGAFRDLQRHRMATVEWQRLTPALGYDVPPEVVEAGCEGPYRESLERSASLAAEIATQLPEQASYAVALAYRIRFSMQMNAREAMHLIELRSGPEGHPGYRAVAQAMHRAIAEHAGHRGIAASMRFVDHGPAELGRLDSAERQVARAASAPAVGPTASRSG
jgi:thymidylate synthase ThyX